MKKFMAIYTAPRAEIEKFMGMPEAEREKAGKEDMEKWNAWNDEHEDFLEDEGTMFGKTKRITAAGAEDAKNELTGYSIVEAETYDDAVQTFKGHPYLAFPGAAIELMECITFDS